MEHPKRLEDIKFPSNKEKLLPSPLMGNKMKKGFFKGLRYFSNIFDAKEPEMQIGYPTNVKHVAHIGWDGHSENSPSWMNGFRSAPLTATVNEDPAEIPKFPSSEFILTGELPRHLEPKSPEKTERTQKPPRRKKASNESAPSSDSPKPESPSSMHSGRRQSRSRESGGDSTEGSSRSRRESRGGGEPLAGEIDAPGIPKQSRRRRTKGSSSNSGGSTQTRSRADGKEEEAGDCRPSPKPANGTKEEISADLFVSAPPSPLTDS